MYSCKQLERCASERSVLSDAAWGVMGDVYKWSLINQKFCDGWRERNIFSTACLRY